MKLDRKHPTGRREADEWKKRRHERHPRTVLFWYKSIEVGAIDPRQGISYCFNLSAGGLGAVVGEHLPSGMLLFVELTFLQKARQLCAAGRVVYSRQISKGRHEMGFEFLALPTDALLFLTHELD